MTRDDKELSALLERIDYLGRVLADNEEKRKALAEEEKAIKTELEHIKETMKRAFTE